MRKSSLYPIRQRDRFTCFALITWILLAGLARSAPLAAERAVRTTPIQIVNTNAGRVMTVGAKRYDRKVYVSGLVYRPFSPGIAPHVHVWGVDAHHHTVFFKTTFVMVTGKPSFIRSEPYVVSVSPITFNKAKLIYVTFHSQTDAQAQEDD